MNHVVLLGQKEIYDIRDFKISINFKEFSTESVRNFMVVADSCLLFLCNIPNVAEITFVMVSKIEITRTWRYNYNCYRSLDLVSKLQFLTLFRDYPWQNAEDG